MLGIRTFFNKDLSGDRVVRDLLIGQLTIAMAARNYSGAGMAARKAILSIDKGTANTSDFSILNRVLKKAASEMPAMDNLEFCFHVLSGLNELGKTDFPGSLNSDLAHMRTGFERHIDDLVQQEFSKSPSVLLRGLSDILAEQTIDPSAYIRIKKINDSLLSKLDGVTPPFQSVDTPPAGYDHN